jgi:3',5'-cyclic AMP phosphodiesterase CpdA
MEKFLKKKYAAGLILVAIMIGAFAVRFHDFEPWIYAKIIQVREAKEVIFPREVKDHIGWITDIHADRFKRRDVDSGLMYPRKYREYLPKVFDALKAQGIDTVIATGDNVNSGDDNYSRDIDKIAWEKDMHVIWVMGNHDNNKTMATLGITGNKYYFVDYGSTRIIVLDDAKVTRETGDYFGGIDDEQLKWLEKALKTPNQVIVAMHVPIFYQDNLSERFIGLEKILHDSGNVKLVLSGHYHIAWQKKYNEIDYYGEDALTRADSLGAYAIIDLKNATVNYMFAK